MKYHAAIAALTLVMGLSSSSFGATLLDQMLGLRGRGHGCCATACCPTACEPACCPQACEPACCPAPCEPACCPAPCEPACCPQACEPACCPDPCADACCPTPCCKRKRTSLLDLIFGHRRKSCCASSCCGPVGCDSCGYGHGAPAPAPAPDMDNGAPVPPAPMVDPAAYVPAQRRVVHAGVNLLR